MPLRLQLSTLALLCIALLSGCSNKFGPMGSISGSLTVNGKAPAEGTKVIFMEPIAGQAGFGLTDAAGAYSIEWRKEGKTYSGLPVGKYQVMLVPAGSIDIDEMSADEMLDGGPPPEEKSAIPAKYLRVATSGLEYDITEGENQVDISVDT